MGEETSVVYFKRQAPHIYILFHFIRAMALQGQCLRFTERTLPLRDGVNWRRAQSVLPRAGRARASPSTAPGTEGALGSFETLAFKGSLSEFF